MLQDRSYLIYKLKTVTHISTTSTLRATLKEAALLLTPFLHGSTNTELYTTAHIAATRATQAQVSILTLRYWWTTPQLGDSRDSSFQHRAFLQAVHAALQLQARMEPSNSIPTSCSLPISQLTRCPSSTAGAELQLLFISNFQQPLPKTFLLPALNNFLPC